MKDLENHRETQGNKIQLVAYEIQLRISTAKVNVKMEYTYLGEKMNGKIHESNLK